MIQGSITLEVATGQVTAGHCSRRRVEFSDFMNRTVADYPVRDAHVIVDNVSTHEPRARSLAGPSSQRPLPLHADLRFSDL